MATPRAAFVDYPLGHTSGRAEDRADQVDLVRRALDLLSEEADPPLLVDLGRVWSDDDSWKEHPLSGGDPGDGRSERVETPVYQNEADLALACGLHPDACQVPVDGAVLRP